MPKITLRAARVNAGLSQNQLAEKIGVAPKTVQRWESGKSEIKPIYLYALCGATGMTPDDLQLPDKYA